MSTRPQAPDNPLVVALDVAGLDRAEQLSRQLAGEVGLLKVGLELFASHGPPAVRVVSRYAPVFLDLKLHDIPTTVGRAAERLGRLGVAMVTVHALGGPRMVTAAVEGLARGSRGTPPVTLGVTVLTSQGDDDLARLGLPPTAETVPLLARLTVDAGAGGVVCAPRDVRAVRKAVGHHPLVVTPGIRPAGDARDDHARGATPARAWRDGADLLVVGRPVTGAADPATAARSILAGLDPDPAARGDEALTPRSGRR